MHSPLQVDAEVRLLLGRIGQLVSANDDDPRRRLLAALIAMWDDDPRLDNRLEAAQHLLTLDQRDVWFVADDPVTALDDAASRLLVALGDAITAAGANFYFDAGEPFIPAGRRDPPLESPDARRAAAAAASARGVRGTDLAQPGDRDRAALAWLARGGQTCEACVVALEIWRSPRCRGDGHTSPAVCGGRSL
jgi:hypothetical protein